MLDFVALGMIATGLLVGIVGLARAFRRAGVGHDSLADIARLTSEQRREKGRRFLGALLAPSHCFERCMIAVGIVLCVSGFVLASFLVK